MDVDEFWNNIHSLDMKRMLVELNSEKTSLIPDVLCPWGGVSIPLKVDIVPPTVRLLCLRTTLLNDNVV